MNILQLCLRIPFPLVDGGNIAIVNTARCLAADGHQVTMLALNTKKHFVESDKLPTEFTTTYNLKAVNIDTSVTLQKVISNLFSNSSLNIIRFYSEEFDALLAKVLAEKKFDLIILESLFMACYIDNIRGLTASRIVLHTHNVEFMIWKRLYDSETNFFKKQYLKILFKRLQKFEIEACNKADAIIALTPNDAAIFKTLTSKPVFEIPLGVDVNSYTQSKTAEQGTIKLFHLGSMDWIPNREAITWFLSNVWDTLSATETNLELHIAGRNMPEEFFAKANEKLKVYGLIEHAREFVNSKDIMIVPLFAGSGMRVKIIEGMASGKCIISTSIGAEGINYTNGIDIFIADTPTDFISIIKKLVHNRSLINEIGFNARQTAQQFYDNAVIGKLLTGNLTAILKSNASE